MGLMLRLILLLFVVIPLMDITILVITSTITGVKDFSHSNYEIVHIIYIIGFTWMTSDWVWGRER